MRQYDPKLVRARSWFEGVSKPRNEGDRRLQRQLHPNVKRRIEPTPAWRERGEGGVHVPIMHMMQGKDDPRKSGIPTTVAS